MNEPPLIPPSPPPLPAPPAAGGVGPAVAGQPAANRPRQVTIAGWIVTGTSALMLLVQLASAPVMFRIRFGWLWWIAALAYAGGRLLVGRGILRGSAGARWIYLLGDVLALNFSVAFLRTAGTPTGAQLSGSFIAVLGYLGVLILLTRQTSLAYFGRPLAPQAATRRIVAAVFAFCLAYALVGEIVFRLGPSTLAIASDRYNPVSAMANAIGDEAGVAFLQSSSYREMKATRQEISQAASMNELSRVLGGNIFDSGLAVNQNSSWIGFLWLANFVAVVLLLRRR